MKFFFFSSRRRHTRWPRDWSSDVCSSDLTSRYSSMPHLPPSRPRPEYFTPPNGTCAAEGMPSLMPTMPYSKIGRAACRERVWIQEGAGALKHEVLDTT